MANKPILEVQVDDAAFKRFLELFNDYNAKLENMPDTWQALNAAMGDAGKTMAEGALSGKEALALAAAQAGIIAEELREAVKAQTEFKRSTDTSNKSLQTLSKTAKGLGSTIFDMGRWVLKMGAVGLGLGVLGSGLGIGSLAGAALSRQRSANSLGLTPGQLSSFQINAQQFLGVGALQAAADAQSDVTKAGLLGQLGIDFNRARNESPVDLAFQELKAARAAWLRAPKGEEQNMPAVQAYLALGGNLGDIRNAAMTPLGRLNAAQRDSVAGAAGLDFDQRTAAEWIYLKKTLDAAGVTIQTVLINHLAPLADPIARLSKEVVNFIAAFINSKNFDAAVKAIRDAFKTTADFLGSKEFRDDLDTFGAAVKQLGPEVVNALRFFNLIPKADDPKGAAARQARDDLQDETKRIEANPLKALGGWIRDNLSIGFTPKNNPLDITHGAIGNKLLFRQFGSTEEGIRAGAALLQAYPKNWNAKTLADAIPIWNGHGANSQSYIANVEKWSGVSRNAEIGKLSHEEIARVISAMSREEGTDPVSVEQVMRALYSKPPATAKRPTKPSNAPMKVSITNSTSARVAISMNAAAFA